MLDSGENPQSGLFYDSPSKLGDALESGVLSDQVESIVIFEPDYVQEVHPDQILEHLGITDSSTEGEY